MSGNNSSWDERLDVCIGFAKEDYHAIDAAVLAESLLGVDQLAHKVNSSLNLRDIELSVKIDAGFRSGSFEYQVILDFFGSILPLIPQIVETMKAVIEYRRFLGGRPPASTEPLPNDEGVKVTNHDGTVNVFQNSVVCIGDSYQATRAIQRMFSPLANGADKMVIGGGSPESAPVVATEADRRALTALEESPPHEEELDQVLEILTAQMDGKTDNWRFYSVDDEAEFTANVADFDFLQAVRESRIAILRNTHAYATVKITRQKINNRARTFRTVLKLRPFTHQEETAQFA